ncbi:MAG: tetratricopeptide repeat protein, partial [Ignavibacteriae bacterium]|nr:tetratricopeptide repeat protein [Ignavibacteriota bacterium]
GENITTGSDIYSLGVLLYQLISGKQPYTFTNNSPLAISKALEDTNIIKPSELAKKTNQENKSTDSSKRKIDATENSKRIKSLKGDLDNIVLKAMHKDSTQRYVSVQGLINDINRYLKGQPVSARKDTYTYRFSKFVQRNKIGVALFILFNIMLLSGIAAIIYQGKIASEERDKAKIENKKFEKVNTFLQEILSSVDPSEIGRDVKVYDILEKAAENVGTELKNQPEVEAAIRSTLGNTYVNLGEYDNGKPFLIEALRLNENSYGKESEQAAFSLHDLALYYDWAGDYKKADSLYEKSIHLLRQVLEKPTYQFATVLNDYGLIKMYFEKYDEAEKLFSEAIEIALVTYGEKNQNTARFMNNFAFNLTDAGKPDEAEKYFKKALAILIELLGENRPEVATSYNNLGYLYSLKKDYKSAEIYLEKSYKLKLALKGKDHSDVGLA